MGNQKNKDKRFDKSYIENKDILNTSWLYFQQHAQQRISYFNFFVAFSTLLTTGMISTFQGDFKNHYIGIFLGITQAFLSVIFLKIDKRNKELTKHGENIIKKIERTYYKDKSLRLFSIEENETEKKRNQERKKYPCIWCKRGMSHGKAFLHIFWAFFIIGLIGAMISLYMLFYVDENTNTNTNTNTNNKTIELNYYQNNIYHNDHIKMDDNIPDVKSTEDTINNIHKKLTLNKIESTIVSKHFTTLASPKVGFASNEKINSFILFFSRLALPLHQSRNSTLRDTAEWCRNQVEQ